MDEIQPVPAPVPFIVDPAIAASVTPVTTSANVPDPVPPVTQQGPTAEPVHVESIVKPPRPPSTTVQQDAEIFVPLDKPYDPSQILLCVPSDTAENIAAAASEMPNIDLESTETENEWVGTIKAARFAVPAAGWFTATANRTDAKYRQAVQSEKGPLAAGAPKFNDSANGKLTGERGVLRIRALTGLGSVVRIPLWHSGFWITIKAPSEGAMLELNRRLAEEKITLGRASYGLAFANNSVFFAGWIMDFALNHIYDSSLKPELQPNLRERISSLDIPIIAWGLACVIWPGGFPYARSVMDQTKEESKVIREKINVGKMLWVDNASLTPWQISHMAGSHGSNMTADAIDRYRNEFTRGKGRVVKLNENISVTLRSPSLDQYLSSGQKWVNNIVNMVDRAFGLPPNDGVRDSYIMDQGKATNMRQFSHFVESLDAAGSIVDDVETLDQTFDALSANDEIREAFFDGVKAFIEDATMAIVAIPVTENEEKSDLPRFPHLLPIDALSVFFILLVQKIPQIQAR